MASANWGSIWQAAHELIHKWGMATVQAVMNIDVTAW